MKKPVSKEHEKAGCNFFACYVDGGVCPFVANPKYRPVGSAPKLTPIDIGDLDGFGNLTYREDRDDVEADWNILVHQIQALADKVNEIIGLINEERK